MHSYSLSITVISTDILHVIIWCSVGSVGRRWWVQRDPWWGPGVVLPWVPRAGNGEREVQPPARAARFTFLLQLPHHRAPAFFLPFPSALP